LVADSSQFRQLLARTNQNVNVVLAAVSVESSLSTEKKEALYFSPQFLAGFENVYDSIGLAAVKLNDGNVKRYMVSNELAVLTASPASVQFLVQVVPLSAKSNDITSLPVELQGLVRVAANWSNAGDWGRLQRTMLDNDKFYDALGLKSQMATVQSMSPTVGREKALALSVLAEVRDGLVDVFVESVKKGIHSSESRQAFEQRVQYIKFGGQ
jgi:hypothetical protein